MARLLRSVASIIVLGALLGCQSFSTTGGAAPSSGRLPAILERGELRVGISGDLPPLNMKNKAGDIIGLEVDIVSALAHAMGLEVVLVETPFPKLIDTLLAGDVDVVISGMTMTPERNAYMAFVGPY